jgi:mannose-6-phosphate isomerase-like protein (cupin superfamily)
MNIKNEVIKNFFSFKEKFDFNSLSNLLDRNNLINKISSNWLQDFVMDSVFKIENVEKDFYFFEIFNLLNNKYNEFKKSSDLYLFFSLVSGNRSVTHRDNYDVYIIGLHGKTLYKVEEQEFILEEGDMLFIPKNSLHKAIGLTPRICLSYGIHQ